MLWLYVFLIAFGVDLAVLAAVLAVGIRAARSKLKQMTGGLTLPPINPSKVGRNAA